MKKVILLTGASSGIGYQTAETLAKQDYTVYGAARRITSMESLKQYGVRPIYLDITNEESISDAVSTIIKEAGQIDILINNAGYGSYGPLEIVPMIEARQQFEVNVFGLMRLTQLVLPHMRRQKSGQIINVSSVGGRLTTYFGGWYHATKYSVEALSDALRMETREFGIDVSIIEPGGIKTNWGLIAADKLINVAKHTPYESQAYKVANGMKKQFKGKMLSNPEIISRTILKAIKSHHPKPRYLIGFGAKPLVFLHTVMPTRMFEQLMRHVN